MKTQSLADLWSERAVQKGRMREDENEALRKQHIEQIKERILRQVLGADPANWK